jgi:hypothetical protein
MSILSHLSLGLSNMAVNCFAFLHMFLAAYETRGYTLEEMDDVFDAAEPAWRKVSRPSRINALEKSIAEGTITVVTPFSRLRRSSQGTAKKDGLGGVATHIACGQTIQDN